MPRSEGQRLKLALLGSCALLIAAPTHHAQAQTAPPASPASDTAAALPQIIVTVNKRREASERVPISLVALDQKALAKDGVKSITDLAAIAPGVEFDTSAGFGPGTETNIAIRGINSSVGASTTGVYIDDTPIQTRIAALSYFGNPYPAIFDVDHIEVDRGPQGTLFGAGSEGGAVRFISPEPSLTKYSGLASAELSDTEGGDPSYEAGLAIGGPIVADRLGFRASLWGRRDGGYVDHVDPFNGQVVDKNANSTDSYSARLVFKLKVSENFTVEPSLFAQSVNNHDSGAYFEYLSDPGKGEFRNGRLLAQPSRDQFLLPSLKLEYDFGKVTLASITSGLSRNGKLTDDTTSYNGFVFGGFGNPLGVAYPSSYADAGPEYIRTGVHSFSQELRLSSSVDPNLLWTAGLFYSRAVQKDYQDVTAPKISQTIFGDAPDAPLFLSTIKSTDQQYAAFGQVDFKLLPKLTLTTGLRVARVEASYQQLQSGPLADSLFPVSAGSQKQTPLSGKIALAYQATPDDLLYGSVSRGYRIGGANQPIPLASTSNPAGCALPSEPGPFNSDSVWSYEVGAKGRALDRKLQFDASAFYIDWQNIQQIVAISSCAFDFIANTGSAVSQGFDLSLRYAPDDHWNFAFSAAYTDAHITRTATFDGAVIVEKGDTVGVLPTVNSPWDINGSVEYRFDFTGRRDGYVRVEDIYHSRNPGPYSSYNPQNLLYDTAIPANPATNELRVRAGGTYRGVDLSLFANNVLDAHPALYRYHDLPGSTLFTNVTLRPRTIGVSVAYRY
ncbi:TonB-dependent receptor [Phenylobacterium montanum]|uniref:TonB-dependent receptor n=1 Tax=Phenylobacterium montanum TaxID=2823693 RepID=A0A975G4L5_9CAUL|nr:TonB-dependent receptor [Caulobacter sp. S6]QUD90546.1 TonB-dependent receptor [Caulobacter sp. S6]